MSTLDGYSSDASDMQLSSDSSVADSAQKTESGTSATAAGSPTAGQPLDRGRIFALMQEIMQDDVVNSIDGLPRKISDIEDRMGTDEFWNDVGEQLENEELKKVVESAQKLIAQKQRGTQDDAMDEDPPLGDNQEPRQKDDEKDTNVAPAMPALDRNEEVVAPAASGSTSKKAARQEVPRVRMAKPLSYIGMHHLQCCRVLLKV
jgi:hypothetical protein